MMPQYGKLMNPFDSFHSLQTDVIIFTNLLTSRRRSRLRLRPERSPEEPQLRDPHRLRLHLGREGLLPLDGLLRLLQVGDQGLGTRLRRVHRRTLLHSLCRPLFCHGWVSGHECKPLLFRRVLSGIVPLALYYRKHAIDRYLYRSLQLHACTLLP